MTDRELKRRREYAKAYAKRIVQERLATGLCRKCGKCPPKPDRQLCADCAEKEGLRNQEWRRRRQAEGKPVRNTNLQAVRIRRKRQRRALIAAGLCARCGKVPPAEGVSLCEACRAMYRRLDRQRYASRRASGRCTRCATPTVDGAAFCGRCKPQLDPETKRPQRRAYLARRRARDECVDCGAPAPDATLCSACIDRHRARARARYAGRRARGECVDCGAPAPDATRCPPCASRRRATGRAAYYRGMPDYPAQYTVIRLDTGENLGTWDSAAEVAGCLAYAKLTPDDVEILSDSYPITSFTSW